MSEGHFLMLFLTTYKVVAIFTGLAFAFMGYKLFVHGIFAEAGELQTNWDNKSLVLRKAAPGTFFACLGTVIVCVSLWRGLTFERLQGNVGGGSGFFNNGVSAVEESNRQNSGAKATRPMVLDDVAILNKFETELHLQNDKGEDSNLAIHVEDSDRIFDLIQRTKATLILSVWSGDWGDREEFRKWARNAPGYFYADPPTRISRAAAVFKGETL